MFKRIAVACNESPEAGRALGSAIHLAKMLGAELRAVTILQELPAYTAYVTAVNTSLTQTPITDRKKLLKSCNPKFVRPHGARASNS